MHLNWHILSWILSYASHFSKWSQFSIVVRPIGLYIFFCLPKINPNSFGTTPGIKPYLISDITVNHVVFNSQGVRVSKINWERKKSKKKNIIYFTWEVASDCHDLRDSHHRRSIVRCKVDLLGCICTVSCTLSCIHRILVFNFMYFHIMFFLCMPFLFVFCGQ